MQENVVGKKIKELIELSGKSQKDFAAKYGINTATLSSYIHGRMLPPLEILNQFCDGEDVSMDWICGREEANPQGRATSFSSVARAIYAVMECQYVADQYSISVREENDVRERRFNFELVENDATQDSKAFFDMLTSLSNNISLSDKLNTQQYEILKDSLLAEYKNWYL